MKKKWLIAFVCILLCPLVITGCGGGSDGGEGGDGESYILRFAHTVPETQAVHQILVNQFKPEIEERSGGRIKVEIYPNGQLGSDRQNVEACSVGNLEMCNPGESTLTTFIPEFEVVGLPFLFTDEESATSAMAGDFGDYLTGLLASNDLDCLGYGEIGFRNITSNKPIRAVGDLKGVKIRTMENPIHMEMFKALGANPSPMSFSELYTALQQGTVDAQENPIALTYNSKFQEVQKYMTITNHVYTSGPWLINKTFLDSLPDDLRQIVIDVGEDSVKAQIQLMEQQNEECLQKLQDDGMEIIEMEPAERKKFVEIAETVYPSVEEKYGKELIELAKKYR